MRRIQKVMTGIFLGGVLLGGIGTGTAMVEYATLSYGGERLVGEEYLVTKNLDYDFPQDGRILVLVTNYFLRRSNTKLETDESVPVGTVRYEITYNEKRAVPELYFEPCEAELPPPEEESGTEPEDMSFSVPEDLPEEDAPREKDWEEEAGEPEPVCLGYLELRVWDQSNPFEIFMENKDYFLEELKQRRISSYKEAYVTSITVKVNPQTRPYVVMENNWY